MAFTTGSAYVNKRFQTCIAPVIGLNGKLAPTNVKCSNMLNSSESGNKFFYGYSRASKPGVSYFACRTKSRNLSKDPYSANENNVKGWFRQAITATKALLADPDKADAALAQWKANPKGYTRLYTFVFAQEFERIKQG